VIDHGVVMVEQSKQPGGMFRKFFCSSRHPDRNDVWCRRQPEHDGPCSAFVHNISVPQEWERADDDCADRPSA
jgi:hypothetical protein